MMMSIKNSAIVLEKKIRNLPEDCLEEVSHYVEYLLYRQETGKRNKSERLFRKYEKSA